jgi:hypothetical protein
LPYRHKFSLSAGREKQPARSSQTPSGSHRPTQPGGSWNPIRGNSLTWVAEVVEVVDICTATRGAGERGVRSARGGGPSARRWERRRRGRAGEERLISHSPEVSARTRPSRRPAKSL